jgi:hypothetical protein
MFGRTHCFTFLLAAATALAFAADSRACSVPVFRYALEHWTPSPYELVVFTRGDLAETDQATLDDLSHDHANIEIRIVDLAGDLAEADQVLWKAQATTTLPWVAIRYPESDENSPNLWAGRLDKNRLASQFDSPARREISQRLLAGQTAVWVLLESGDKPADDRLASRLSETLKRFEKTIKLPDIAPDGPQLESPLPLSVSFSILRVARNDAREAALVSMLSIAEPDLAHSTEALVIPVLGRGRAISALAASHLNEQSLTTFAQFICGQCSCEVKELNPGIDLLLTADWETIFKDRQPPDEESSMPKAGVAVPIPVTATVAPLIHEAPTSESEAHRNTRPWLMLAIFVAAALALVSGAIIIRSRRSIA